MPPPKKATPRKTGRPNKNAMRYTTLVNERIKAIETNAENMPATLSDAVKRLRTATAGVGEVASSVRKRRKIKSYKDQSHTTRVYTRADPDITKAIALSESISSSGPSKDENQDQQQQSSNFDPLEELEKLNKDARTRVHREILQREPYWNKMTRDVASTASTMKRSDIPAVHAKHVHKFLCAPYGNRRECVFGMDCIARMIPHPKGPITAVEFLNEEENAVFEKTGELPTVHSFCYFCHLYFANTAFWYIVRKNALPYSTYALFRHIVGVPGEYKIEACIQPKNGTSEGIIFPVRYLNIADYMPVDEMRATPAEDAPLLRNTAGDPVPGWIETASAFF